MLSYHTNNLLVNFERKALDCSPFVRPFARPTATPPCRSFADVVCPLIIANARGDEDGPRQPALVVAWCPSREVARLQRQAKNTSRAILASLYAKIESLLANSTAKTTNDTLVSRRQLLMRPARYLGESVRD